MTGDERHERWLTGLLLTLTLLIAVASIVTGRWFTGGAFALFALVGLLGVFRRGGDDRGTEPTPGESGR